MLVSFWLLSVSFPILKTFIFHAKSSKYQTHHTFHSTEEIFREGENQGIGDSARGWPAFRIPALSMIYCSSQPTTTWPGSFCDQTQLTERLPHANQDLIFFTREQLFQGMPS